MKWPKWSRPALALVSVTALGFATGGAAAAGVQSVRAGLPQVLTAASCSGGVCSVGVDEGATGFPVSVGPVGVTAQAGAVPAGDYVAVSAGGTQLDNNQAGTNGAFSLPVPAVVISPGAMATISWSSSAGSVEPSSGIGQQVQFLARDQLPDGAILYSPTAIEPYFGNIAAIGLAEVNTAESDAEVLGWMKWYMAHLNATDSYGLYDTIYDYSVSGSGAATVKTSMGTMDRLPHPAWTPLATDVTTSGMAASPSPPSSSMPVSGAAVIESRQTTG